MKQWIAFVGKKAWKSGIDAQQEIIDLADTLDRSPDIILTDLKVDQLCDELVALGSVIMSITERSARYNNFEDWVSIFPGSEEDIITCHDWYYPIDSQTKEHFNIFGRAIGFKEGRSMSTAQKAPYLAYHYLEFNGKDEVNLSGEYSATPMLLTQGSSKVEHFHDSPNSISAVGSAIFEYSKALPPGKIVAQSSTIVSEMGIKYSDYFYKVLQANILQSWVIFFNNSVEFDS
jgi:hypothetical protein